MKNVTEGIAMTALPANGVDVKEERPRVAPSAVYDVAPGLGHFTDDVLFGEVWDRKELAPRDRSLVTMAALVAIGQPEQLRFHANRAMDNGLSQGEASEVVTHVAFYAGWPRAMSAAPVLKQFFENREKRR